MSCRTGLCTRSSSVRLLSATLLTMLVGTAASAATINVPVDVPTIQGAIAAASPGDLILVAPGTYNEQLDLLGKALVIRGTAGAAQTTVSGGGTTGPVITMSTIGGGVTLQGLTISGGSLAASGTGAGISTTATPLRIEGCIVEGNVCFDGAGAGLSVVGGTVEIVSSTFRNNAAAVLTTGAGLGGAISVVDGTLIVSGSTFEANQSVELGGGAIGASGTSVVTITSSTFTGNSAATTSTGSVSTTFGGGGAIAIRDSATLTITGGSFATNSVTRGNGSAIKGIGTGNTASIIIDGTTFTGNTASGNAAVETAAAGPFVVRNALFEGNVANGGIGGAIAQGSTNAPPGGSIIENTIFRNNTAAVAGALATTHQTTVTDCLFEGNRAVGATSGSFVLSGGSGAVRVNSGVQLTTFDGCTFRNNNVNSGSTPDNEGGAVRVRRSNVSFIDCTFQNNTATNNRGAGIWLEALQSTARNALIRNCTFTGNETLGPTNQQGGAIGMSGRVVLTIENSDFANNIAPNAGAHIWNEQQGGGLIVSNTIFRDATSRQGAGIIFPARSDATVSFTDVQFRNLHAAVTPDNQGGDWAAANVTANTILLNRVLVENCTARNVAGIKTAGTSTTSTTTIQDSIFRNLVATPVNNNGGDYGAGDIGGGITVVRNVTVSDCSAKFVGGLAVGGSTSSLVEDSTFTNCFGIPTASGSFGDVGGLRLSGTTATARRLTFNNCRSKIGGGLWAISTGTLTVEESTFTDCQAIPTASDSFGDGGGARLDGLNVIARNLTFVNNRARVGAGLHLSGGGTTSTAILEDITCIGGIAAPAPGGNANNARGGGIFVSRQGPTRLDRIRLIGNTAGRGGGLWSDSLDATLTNMLITGNTATDRGGGVMLDGIGGTPRKHVLSASTIVGNAAGGVVFGSCDAVAESSVSNTIVRASTGLANIQNFCGTQPTVDVTYSNIAGGYLGLGNIDDDPAFANPASGDYSLTASSTSINAGDAASLPPQITLDLSRAARVAGGGLDIGAFEFQGGNPCEYDFNQDENVDLLDAQQMAQVFVGLISPEAGWLDGDLNGDENADLTDAQLLASFVVTGNCGV